MAATLCPGVLEKLLQQMVSSSDELPIGGGASAGAADADDAFPRSPPALLLVTSIVPAMGVNDGLFPDRGFHVKVSDSSHAIYAALPPEHGDLVLADELRLGQLIRVHHLERASPVPVLRGVEPLPGRFPCVGDPSDLFAADAVAAGDEHPAGFGSVPRDGDGVTPTENQGGDPSAHSKAPPESDQERKPTGKSRVTHRKTSPGDYVPPLPDGRRKPRSLSASRRVGDGWKNSRKERTSSRSIPTSPVRSLSRGYSVDAPSSEILKELAKISVACAREDSDDSDSSRSSASSSVSRARTLRRSWDASTTKVDGHKRDPVPIPRSQNKFAQSESQMLKGYTSDHQLIAKRHTGQAMQLPRSSKQQKLFASNVICKENSCSSCSFGSLDDIKRVESSVLPASLPSSLLKIGKEVLRHRDLALLTAVEALQEASASERLIQCLSTYPELQSSKGDDPQGLVDRFLSLLNELKQARLVAQSLAKLTPRTANSDSISSLSIKDAVKIATESRKHAASWIKAAMESDNPTSSTLTEPIVDSTADPTADGKPPSTIAYLKILPFARNRGLSYDTWLKGAGPLVAANLASTLQGECNRWFMSYIEKLLDSVLSETNNSASENQVAGLLSQIRKVDEWLEGIACREASSLRDSYKDNLAESEELEACQRVRRKIYGILLKHVDRAVTALENMSATDEGSASEEQ